MPYPDAAANAARLHRYAGALFLIGVVLYVLPTILHGNPPIDDAEATLRYVDERRSFWAIAHYGNVAAVAAWLAGFCVLVRSVRLPRTMATVATAVFAVATAVFAVYYGIHALGLRTAADQFFEQGADRAAVLERTESLLLVLGSEAFVAQALLGAAIALVGITLAAATGTLKLLGWSALVIGLGWAVGALVSSFAIIVPFTTIGWLWFSVFGIMLLSGRPAFPEARSQRTTAPEVPA
jgi:hypothetical protein